jgi:hypothetical protein
MDQDLKVYLDEQFARIDERFAKVDERFEGIDQRFLGIDQRFLGIDQRFEHMDQKLENFRQETRGRFEKLEDEVHLNRIVTEGLRDDLRQVADGVAANSEKLEKLQRLFEDSHTKLEARVTRLEAAQRTTFRTTKK